MAAVEMAEARFPAVGEAGAMMVVERARFHAAEKVEQVMWARFHAAAVAAKRRWLRQR